MRVFLLLPLLLLIGFEATLFSNFPFPWKIGGCPGPGGLGLCSPITHNWFNFEMDLLFYTLFQYWLIVVVIGAHQRKLSSALPLGRALLGKLLGDPFKLALLGGALMLAIPLLTFPPAGNSLTYACLYPSPCQTRLDNMFAGWHLTTILWGISGIVTMFTAPLGVVEDKWHRLLGSSLIGLSAVHLSAMEVFFASGAYGLFKISEILLPAVATALGPLVVLWGAHMTLRISPMH